MLCNLCGEIILDLSHRDSTDLIRHFTNLDALRAAAEECDFCALIYNSAKRLKEPGLLDHCKERWGAAFDEALELCPVNVFHIALNGEHNVVWKCHYDVWKCKSYSAGPLGFQIEEEYGGLYVDPASPLASSISGRDFQAHPSKSQMIEVAKSWHDICNVQHVDCAPTDRQVALPKRLVDLGPSNGSDIRPCVCISSEGALGSYLALSYCWGESMRLCLTYDSLPMFTEKGLPFDQVPQTLQDSFALCRALGFRFIWVDRLCIIQDSEQDWREQASMMGIIYSQAAIVIRAAAGFQCDSGLFSPRERTANVSVQLPCKLSGGVSGECFLRGWQLNKGRDALDSRGWALQESILASRILTFGRMEMTWECQHGVVSESRYPTKTLVPGGRVLPRSLRQKQRFTYLEDLESDGYAYADNFSKDKSLPGSLYHELWQQILESYSARSLTFEKDKLPAIAGIAWRFSRRNPVQNDAYLAGLWQSHLPEGLLWYHDLPADWTATRPSRYRAPSWSWASLDCRYLKFIQRSDVGASLTEILSVQTTTAEKDHFGRVTGGSIQVLAPLRQGWILPSPYYRDIFELHGDDWREERKNHRVGSESARLGKALFDMRRTAEPEDDATPAYCLMIAEKAALLIEPRDDPVNDGLWTRVGVVKFFGNNERWRNECQKRTITIV